MNRPAHAPYATGVQSFSIGLKPLDPADWIEADGGLGYTLRRLIRVSRHGRKEKSHIHQIASD